MTRILSYNILFGGAERIDLIERMIRSADPDVVGLVEADNPTVVKELATRLGMDYCLNASPADHWPVSLALLSRLPIVQSTVYDSPGLLSRPLLEVTLEEPHGEQLTVFVTHLVAHFAHGRGNDTRRRREIREVLRILRAHHGPHLLMGDFNALAPGDTLKASNLLRHLVEMDKQWHGKPRSHARNGHPSFGSVIPWSLSFLNPLLSRVPRSRLFSTLFDAASSLYVARGTIHLMQEAGYVDCFRYVNPRAWGFTCPAEIPAGRIDYLFANPILATRLASCKVISGNAEVDGGKASDHLPVMAEFGGGIETTFRPYKDELVEMGKIAGE